MPLFTLDALLSYLTACGSWKEPDCLVLGHPAPDTDAVVSSVFEAFRRYLIDGVLSVPVVQDAVLPREVAFLLGDAAALIPTQEWRAHHPDTSLVLTDHFEDVRQPHQVIAVVDHHQPGNTADFTGVNVTIRQVGAATTLVTLACRRDGLLPDPAIARMLLGAILLDTDGLAPSKTHQEDHEAAAWLTALCGEDSAALYGTLRDQLLMETDPSVLYHRDYRLYADPQGRPLLGFAILKVWDTAQPDKKVVRRLLADDLEKHGCRVCVAKICAYTTEGQLQESYLAAGQPAAVKALLETVQKAGGDNARKTADDEVFLPPAAIHRGRKSLAAQLLTSIETGIGKYF